MPDAEDIAGSIEHVLLVRSFLAATSMGVPGWGEGGQALSYLSSETEEGQLISEHKYYEEEVVAKLRGAVPAKTGSASLLGAFEDLPLTYDLAAPAKLTNGYDQIRTKMIERQILLSGLTRARLVTLDEEACPIVQPSMLAAAAYFRADITSSIDRKVYDLLAGTELQTPEAVQQEFPIGSSTQWWAVLEAALDDANITSDS